MAQWSFTHSILPATFTSTLNTESDEEENVNTDKLSDEDTAIFENKAGEERRRFSFHPWNLVHYLELDKCGSLEPLKTQLSMVSYTEK